MRKFCEKRRNWDNWVKKGPSEEAYNLRILYGSDVYDSTRLHRTDARWFYVGVTHEYMTNAHKRVAIKRAMDDQGNIRKFFILVQEMRMGCLYFFLNVCVVVVLFLFLVVLFRFFVGNDEV